MTDFLPDAVSFKGLKRKKMPRDGWPPPPLYPCPKCKTYGGWNLKLNAYDYPHVPKEQRHFNASCGQCQGIGWVTKEDRDCMHEWEEMPAKAMYDHPFKCKKCGKTVIHDSSG